MRHFCFDQHKDRAMLSASFRNCSVFGYSFKNVWVFPVCLCARMWNFLWWVRPDFVWFSSPEQLDDRSWIASPVNPERRRRGSSKIKMLAFALEAFPKCSLNIVQKCGWKTSCEYEPLKASVCGMRAGAVTASSQHPLTELLVLQKELNGSIACWGDSLNLSENTTSISWSSRIVSNLVPLVLGNFSLAMTFPGIMHSCLEHHLCIWKR